MNLSGFSAVYPGYQAAENTQAEVEKNQAAAKEAAFKLLGAQVLGRALTGAQPPAPGAPGQPQGQPMAPPPGQPSMPNQPPPPQAPPASSAPPAAMPAPGAAGAPPAQGGSGLPEISLPALTQRILQTTPQIKDHPEILLAALERAAPLLDRQSKEDLAEMRKEFQTRSLEQRAALASERMNLAREQERGRNDRSATAEKGRQDRFDTREARLAASTAVRQDQGYQRLQLQAQALADRAQATGDKKLLGEWRATVDAMHKRAQEIINANSINSNLSKTDKDALLMEQRQGYEQAISGMRQRMGSITPTGGTVPEGAPAAPKVEGRVPQNAPLVTGGGNPPPVTVPPAILQDAQRAIAAGAPRAAVIKRLQDQGYPTDGL